MIGFTTLIFLIVMETTARVLVGPSPQTIYDRVESFAVPEKAVGTFRIVVIGGSTVAGWPNPEVGFTSFLDYALQRIGSDVAFEVVNLGYLGKTSEYTRQMAEDSQKFAPDCIIIMSGHNEFLNRIGENNSIRDMVSQFALRSAAVRMLLLRTGIGVPPYFSPQYRLPHQLRPYDPNSLWYQARIERHQENLAAIADWGRRHRIPIILCTLPSNILDWPPVYKFLPRGKVGTQFEEGITHAREAIARGDIQEGEFLIDNLEDLVGADAMLTFLRGKVRLAQGDYAEAQDLFEDAKNTDPFPYRTLSVMNDNIRRTAKEYGAVLCDLDEAFADESDHGLVGSTLIGDSVHPTALGNALISREIARSLLSAGMISDIESELSVNVSLSTWVEAVWTTRYSPLELQAFEFEAASSFGRFCQKYPFFNFDLAVGYQRKVIELSHEIGFDRWEHYGELGTLLIMTGKTAQGIEKLRTASVKKGSPLVLSDAKTINWLQPAMESAGINPEDLDNLVAPSTHPSAQAL